jgi:hypothetical protein
MAWAAHLWDVERNPALFPAAFDEFYFRAGDHAPSVAANGGHRGAPVRSADSDQCNPERAAVQRRADRCSSNSGATSWLAKELPGARPWGLRAPGG